MAKNYWANQHDLPKIQQLLHSWLDECPSGSVEIIADDNGYWDIRVRSEKN